MIRRMGTYNDNGRDTATTKGYHCERSVLIPRPQRDCFVSTFLAMTRGEKISSAVEVSFAMTKGEKISSAVEVSFAMP